MNASLKDAADQIAKLESDLGAATARVAELETASRQGADRWQARCDHIAKQGLRWKAEAEGRKEHGDKLQARVTELESQLADVTYRARRVAISHEHFIQDHQDPGTEALAAQYELMNWLSASQHHADLPLNPIENALRIILAELDQLDDEVNPRWIRQAIAEALPREDMSDRRRRIYVDGRGEGWVDQSVTSDGTRWVVSVLGSLASSPEPTDTVAERTGSLREIGRCW